MEDQNFTLVAVETSGIQSYIFNSNRLKENIGASYLVAIATGKWAYECVDQVTDKNNVDDLSRQIEKDSLDAEVLYSGGGNFVVLFRTSKYAIEFTRELSRKVLLEAPGLPLTFVKSNFDWHNDVLSKAVSKLLRELGQARSHQPLKRGVGGLGVTMMCNSSSLPATTVERDLDNNWQVYSSEVVAKRNYAPKANTYLKKLLKLEGLPFDITTEFDELGRTKGESSFIAVVHADGNGLGLLIQELDCNPAFNTVKGNRAYIDFIRGLSEGIKQANRECQQAMSQTLIRSIQQNNEIHIQGTDGKTITLNRIKRDDGGYDTIFPLRPLVSGGDDITFVCDGRIGLDLAVIFLEKFEENTRHILKAQFDKHNLPFEKMTACAGVAIVNSHYPFARAYDLADQLAGEAKKLVNRHKNADDKIVHSAIDWHFTTGGLYDELDKMREREYQVEGGIYDNEEQFNKGSLTLRPLFVNNNLPQSEDFLRNWRTVQSLVINFQRAWSGNRSKAKGLMGALRQGKLEVEVFSLRYLDGKLTLPPVQNVEPQFGWENGHCWYYDALELMDLYLPLHSNSNAQEG